MMKDSKLNVKWLQEMMQKNPPKVLANGNIFSGPVRLCFPNLFKPQAAKGPDAGEPKFGADLLFPLGQDMSVFNQVWIEEAKKAHPKNWNGTQPIGLHSPFHDQQEKAFGVKSYAGYTPGAIHFTTSSKFKPAVVDANMNLIVDESKVYPGVWAFVTLNSYPYSNRKTGIGFGLQTVMIIADDTKLGGGGGDPQKDFAHVQITAQSDIAAKFEAGGVMPAGGHVGHAGQLPIQELKLEDVL